LLRAHQQALLDLALSRASEVTFARVDEGAGELAGELVASSQDLGFVTARVSLRGRPLSALDEVIRAIAAALSRKDSATRGLGGLLTDFARLHQRRALAVFDEGVAREALRGDLVVLGRAFLSARQASRRELERLAAWFEGVALARSEESEGVLTRLEPRTAKQTLGQLTRLIRVLGATGLVVVLEDAEACARLPDKRRDDAYTVLRELLDDGDSPRGMVATRVLVVGGKALFVGPRALGSVKPLASRVLGGSTGGLSPHQPYLVAADTRALVAREGPIRPDSAEAAEIRWLVRAAHGLPPIEAVSAMSVGAERIDATVDRLFEHTTHQGSVFAALTGSYGSGKTHLLLHLEERALNDDRPVLRLSLERLDGDLGSPQRHLRRLLASSSVRLASATEPVSLLDVLDGWLADGASVTRLLEALEAAVAEGGEAARAATRALRDARAVAGPARASGRARALTSFLGGRGLDEKPSGPSYRVDAYRRLLLWLSLLERLEQRKGPVLLVDEAENLVRRSTHAERRTALRSLSFYCGGALPSACVLLAITPEAFGELSRATNALVRELAAQETTLACEDVVMLGRRLSRLAPIEVPALGRPQMRELALRVRQAHARVRGAPVVDNQWDTFVGDAVAQAESPRQYVRALVERLEHAWWARPLH